MTTNALIFGDPHGDFRSITRAASLIDPDSPPLCILLGDFDLEVPLEKAVEPLVRRGCEIVYVHGNHEADRVTWYDNVFSSSIADRNLTGKVIDVGGVRIAGLGGVFKGKIWHPKDKEGHARFRSREDFLAAHPNSKWRGGLPLGLRATIFPEDYEALADLRADILVTHEAPSCHRYGFEEIDLLAAAMGAKAIIHGHHHEPYQAELGDGIMVVGMGQADVMEFDLSGFKPASAICP